MSRMLIGAERVTGSGNPLSVENLYTEETIETIASATAEEVDTAGAAAREAARGWAAMPAGERAELLSTLALADCLAPIPSGVVNLIAGDGAVGARLVANQTTIERKSWWYPYGSEG